MLERMVENYNPENPETNATPEEEEIIRYLLNLQESSSLFNFMENTKIVNFIKTDNMIYKVHSIIR